MPRQTLPPPRLQPVDRGRGALWWLAVSAAGAALAILAGLAAL